MGERLTDAELRAAAARRPGYATYPQYRPGQPERLGQLPAVTAPQRLTKQGGDQVVIEWWLCPNEPRCPHGAVLHDVDDYDDPSPTCCVEGCGCGRAKVQGLVPGTPAPVMVLKTPASLTHDDASKLAEAFLAAARRPPQVLPPPAVLDARPDRPAPSPAARTAAALLPQLDDRRPYWLPRWSWAVLTASGDVLLGYSWTKPGARRRGDREARRAAR